MNGPSSQGEPRGETRDVAQPDLEGFMRDHEKHARRSRLEGYGFLYLILLLLGGAFGVWRETRDIATEDVKASVEATDESAPELVAPLTIDFEDVAFCGTTAIAAGSQGVIRVSTDKGGLWAEPHTGAQNDLHAVAFGDDCKAVVAVGEDGAVLVSTDGGGAWETPDTHTRNDFNDVALSGDGQTAVAVGKKGLVRLSTDGGQTWRKPAEGTGRNIHRVALSRDGHTAVAVGRDNLVMVSTDGGETWTDHGGVWTAAGGDGRDDFEAVALRGDGTAAVVVGDNGAVLFSANVTVAGGGWTPRIPCDCEPGERGRYTDGRDTGRDGDWRRNADFNDVALSGDGQTAVAVGREGLVWVSTNGGRKWFRRDSREGNNLEAVALSHDGGVAIAVGRDGAIVVSANPDADPDKETWRSRDGGTANRLFAVALDAGGTTLIAAGEDSTILRSESSPGAVFRTIEAVSSGPATGEEQRMPRPEHTPDADVDASQPCERPVEECEKSRSQEERVSDLAALIQSNLLRVGVTLLFLFMAQHLFGLVRYKLRLAAFHQSRRAAIHLVPKDALPRSMNTEELGQLMHAVSPDALDIGHPSRTVTDRMMKMMERLVAGGRRSRERPPEPPVSSAARPEA